MARTHRSSSVSEESIPKYFGKTGIPQDPNRVKKNGAGRFNWGQDSDDFEDLEGSHEFHFFNQHRRSNSTVQQDRPVF